MNEVRGRETGKRGGNGRKRKERIRAAEYGRIQRGNSTIEVRLDLDSHRQDGTGRETVGQGGVPGYLSMKHGIVFRAGMMGNVMMPPIIFYSWQ
jgi:hypothetical protein